MTLKYCQGPKCHTYHTKDRLKGPKGNKTYQTRRRSSFYNLGGNACGIYCERDWFDKFGERAINHFGRVTQPTKLTEENAWVKYYDWRSEGHRRYWLNKITDERIPITEQQYDDKDLVRPS